MISYKLENKNNKYEVVKSNKRSKINAYIHTLM